jgi:hypothetical protein
MAQIHVVAEGLPPEYYAPFGELIFRWAQLEYQMQEIIWRAMGLDNKQGRVLTIGKDARAIIQTLRTITLRWTNNATDKQLACSIAHGATQVIEFRNHLAHCSWQHPPGEPDNVYLHYMKEKEERLLPKAKKHDPDEIRAKADKLQKLNEKAAKLIARLEERQRALREKSSAHIPGG